MPAAVRPKRSITASPLPDMPNVSPTPTARIGTGYCSAATERTASARPPAVRCSSAVTARPVRASEFRTASESSGLMIATFSTSASMPSSRCRSSAASSARQTM